MQKIVTVITKLVHKLIVQEVDRRCNEKQCKEVDFESRLKELEKTFGVKSDINVKEYRLTGSNIIAIRTRLNLSQATFARLLNVNRAALCHWEHGTVKPSRVTALKIIEYRTIGKKIVKARLQKIENDMWQN